MKQVITLIVAIVIGIASMAAQQNKSNLPNNTPATLGDLRFVNNRVAVVEKENANLKQRLATLETVKPNASTSGVTEARVIQLIDQRAVSMPHLYPKGKYNQLVGKVDLLDQSTQTRFNNVGTAMKAMTIVLQQHETAIVGLQWAVNRLDSVQTINENRFWYLGTLSTEIVRTEADKDDFSPAGANAFTQVQRMVGIGRTQNQPSRSFSDRTRD